MSYIAAVALMLFSAAPPLPHTIEHKRNDKQGYWTSDYAYVQFQSQSRLAKVANEALEHSAEMAMEQFVEACNDVFKTEPKPENAYTAEEKPTIEMATPKLISVYGLGYEFTGGAHPSYYFSEHNFGFVAGQPKELTLEDILRPGTSAREGLGKLVIRKLRAKHASNFDDPSVKTIDPKLLEQFVVTKGGLLFLFAPYDVGSYAEGAYKVRVSFKELKPYLRAQGPLTGMAG